MVRAIREAHTLARNTARASAQAVGRAAGSAGHAATNDSAYATAIASANAWATRLGKQPPFVALTLAMPGGVPVSRANVRALVADS
jgi:hypothetical protein